MLRSHEDDELNARQNATTERSAAAMLDKETERELYALYKAHFTRADAERLWNPWSSVAWPTESEASTPSTELIEATLALWRDATLLPDYAAINQNLLRASRGRAWFWTHWTYEKSKHLVTFLEWLQRRGGWSQAALSSAAEELLTQYRWEPPCEEATGICVDALLYELSQLEKLEALNTQAQAEGESTLAELTAWIILDTQAQRDYLAEALRIIGSHYPERLTEALNTVAASHEAPELAIELATYLQ
jgi:acyl-[acyl-carrier-protein] desaturase